MIDWRYRSGWEVTGGTTIRELIGRTVREVTGGPVGEVTTWRNSCNGAGEVTGGTVGELTGGTVEESKLLEEQLLEK